MVTTPESSSNHHSLTTAPPPPLPAAGDSNSPKFPTRWAEIVRRADPESSSTPAPQSPPPASSPSSSDANIIAPDQLMTSSDSVVDNSNSDGNTAAADSSLSDINIEGGNVVRSKKPVWNKPSLNGVVTEAGPVMGAESWPALSESTKVSGKSQQPDTSSKTAAAADGSLSTTSQAPVTPHSPQKQATSHAKPNSATNMPNRQRSMKRGGGSNIGSGPAQSSFSNPPPPPPPPPFPVYQLHPASYGIPDHSPRDHYRNNNWDARPPVGGFVHAMNDYRGSSRRGNFGNHLRHPRGDGSYHNYGSRRDQDAHVQPRMPPPRGLLRHPPPTSDAFVAPQPMGPFPNPFGFPEFYYYPNAVFDHFRGMPFFTHGPPPAMFLPAVESPLTNMIVNQIDYYFSDANLVKDEFLRSNMDEQGWVPITLIANFPRVKSLTINIQFILDTMRASTVVEVQDNKLRRLNEWRKWLPSAQLRANSGSTSPGGSRYNNNLAADLQTITLEPASKVEGSSKSESFGQSQFPNGDAAATGNRD
ncbi:hypothetical protein RIF29_13490 [Crotalaria pallida]|uniref:HTH La-type RNA-binding domain-containing protein n=1 Tax=Crotalaria pallida TaxID=3830 RepID=A0AAN9P341_CROPI